jgi:phosphatidylcholine synthase
VADGPSGGAGMGARTLLAWLAHLYTALGLAAAAAIAVLIVRGDEESFRLAFLWMGVAIFIDASDGWLARRARVGERIPWFDGRRLDDLIDFHTYTTLPLLLVWRAQVLSPEHAAWLLLPLLASAYGFSQVDAKTDDGFFLGFPSYWNVVALYLVFLPLPTWAALATVVGLAVLTFLPFRYLYPSQPGRLNRITVMLGAVWAALVLAGLLGPAATREGLIRLSLFFPVYYLTVSWLVTFRRWRAGTVLRAVR